MDEHHGELLPGSRDCVGCGGLTFRMRDDGLCPRCAFEAESLIERIEIEGLSRDLQLITEFEAYYQHREEQRLRFQQLGSKPVFAEREQSTVAASLDPAVREPAPFGRDAFWASLRDAS